MKTLVLFRHAKSSWKNTHLNDHDRPLNQRGIENAPLMARLLHEKVNEIDCVMSSTAKRAELTCQAILAAAKTELRCRYSSELYLPSRNQLEDFIYTLNGLDSTVVLVGHNPSFHEWVEKFGCESLDEFPTAGFVILKYAVDSWSQLTKKTCTSQELYYPKLFKNF